MQRIISKVIIFLWSTILLVAGSGLSEMTADASEEIKVSDLFYEYPAYLIPADLDELVGQEYAADRYLQYTYNAAWDAIYTLQTDDEKMVQIITGLQSGIDYAFNDILILLGLGQDVEEKCIDKATEYVLASAVNDESIMKTLYESHSSLSDSWNALKSGDDIITSGAFVVLSETQRIAIDEALKEKSAIFDFADAGINMIQTGLYIGYLEQIDGLVLDYLIETVEQEELRESLLRYDEWRNEDYKSYIKNKYLTEEGIKLLEKAFVSVVNQPAESFDVLFKCLKVVFKAVGNNFSSYTGLGNYEQMITAMKVHEYVSNYKFMKDNLITTYQSGPFFSQEALRYEKCYETYVASVRAFAMAAADMNANYKERIELNMENVDEFVSYEKHIEGCILAIKLDAPENRKRIKNNPNVFYILDSDIKVADATNKMEENHIYFSEESLNYSILVEKTLEFEKNGGDNTLVINGDLVFKGGTVTIPSGVNLKVTGDCKSVHVIIPQMRPGKLYLNGSLSVDGALFDTDKDHGRIDVIMEEDTSLLEVRNGIDNVGEWTITSGDVILEGDIISIKHLDNIGDASFEVRSNAGNTIMLSEELQFEPIENAKEYGAHIIFAQNADGSWIVNTDTPSYDVNSLKSIDVEENFVANNMMMQESTLNVNGNVQLLGDYVGILSNMNINGCMNVLGDYVNQPRISPGNSRNELNINGIVNIGGAFKDHEYHSYTDVNLLKEDAVLNISGDIFSRGTWVLKTKRMDFNGGNIRIEEFDIGSCFVNINGDKKGTVQLPMITIERKENEAANMVLAANELGYELLPIFNDSGSTVTSISLNDYFILKGGTYFCDVVRIDETATLDVTEDIILGGNLINNGLLKMTTDNHMVVEGDYTVSNVAKNHENMMIAGILEIKGDFKQSGSQSNFAPSNEHETVLSGEEKQVVELLYPSNNAFNNLTIENKSQEGVYLQSSICVNGLFNHNQNEFTFRNGESNSHFIDSDKDGTTDENDPYPTNPAISGYALIIEPIDEQKYYGEVVRPELEITDESGNFLLLGKDYQISFRGNTSPGQAVAIVSGLRFCYGSYEIYFDIVCGHKCEDWEVIEEPTYEKSGIKKAICLLCEEEVIEEIPQLSEPPIDKHWKQDNVGWWYQNDDGTYPHNCWKEIDGEWYYFNASGYRVEGWLKLSGTWYYFGKETGIMYADEWLDNTYYFHPSGAMATGWLDMEGDWYYFNASGAKVANSWVGSYWLDADGVMATSAWVDNGKSYVNASGIYQTGWLLLDGDWYYLGTNGVLQKGWIKVGGTWYYGDKADGRIYEQEWLDDTYYFKDGGAMVTGWCLLNGDYYCFAGSGAKVTNQWVGNYYLKDDGKMAVSEWIGNYYVGADGAWIPGYKR